MGISVIFRRKKVKNNVERSSLAGSYLSRVSSEERIAFLNHIQGTGISEETFRSLSDGDAMTTINRFRASDWYRRNAEICRLSMGIDPSAKVSFNAREGYWRGNVELSLWREICGYCSNCGRQIVDNRHHYVNGENMICQSCFDLLRKFAPIMVNHVPGFVANDNEFEYHVWCGWDDFISRFPPKIGWHYEWAHNHIVLVDDDRKEWWVIWNIHHPDILREVMERCPQFRAYP